MRHYCKTHDLSEQSASSLLKFSMVLGQDTRPCPICLKHVTEDRAKHLAIHLLRISLIVLPNLYEEETIAVDEMPEFEMQEQLLSESEDEAKNVFNKNIRLAQFCYEPLSPGSYSIRLLCLFPSSPDNPQIEGELVTIHLPDNRQDAFPFEILSHYSGRDDSNNNRYIALHIKRKVYAKYISPTLFNALCGFRSPTHARYLWCDAICINHDDLDEVGLHVSAMSDIFGYARRTLIWLGDGTSSSTVALTFIKNEVLPLRNFQELCEARDASMKWRAMLDLMSRPWFTRLYSIQELALSTVAILYCGVDHIQWLDFATAIELFVEVETATHRLSEVMKKDLQYYHVPGWLEFVSSLGASLAVDAAGRIFRYGNRLPRARRDPYDSKSDSDYVDADGSITRPQRQVSKYLAVVDREPLSSLEYLVAKLAAFESTGQHDAIYCLLSISRDCTPAVLVKSRDYASLEYILSLYTERKPYVVDYSLPYVDVCRNFVQFCITSRSRTDPSRALDVICRAWATDQSLLDHRRWQDARRRHRREPAGVASQTRLKGNLQETTQPLPSWVGQRSRASFGMYPTPGIDVLKLGRKNADSLVGLPGSQIYSAAGTKRYDSTNVKFRKKPLYYSMFVGGFVLDQIDRVGSPAMNGSIPMDWSELAEWDVDLGEAPPDDFWRTLVADRDKDGRSPPVYYERACQEAFLQGGYRSGDVDTSGLINYTQNSVISQFCRRVQAVIWNRSLIMTRNASLGLVNRNARTGDLICIIPGCSVPVVLRRSAKKTDEDFDLEVEREVKYLADRLVERSKQHLKQSEAFWQRVAASKYRFSEWNHAMKRQWLEDLDWRMAWCKDNQEKNNDLARKLKQRIVQQDPSNFSLRTHVLQLISFRGIETSLRIGREFRAWKEDKMQALYRLSSTQRDSSPQQTENRMIGNERPYGVDWNEFGLELKYGRLWRKIVRLRKNVIRYEMEEQWRNRKNITYPSTLLDPQLRGRLQELEIAHKWAIKRNQENQEMDYTLRVGLSYWQSERLSPEEATSYEQAIYRNCAHRLRFEDRIYYYELLGECYVHGAMDGQAIAYQNAEGIRSQIFELR